MKDVGKGQPGRSSEPSETGPLLLQELLSAISPWGFLNVLGLLWP